MFGTYFVFRTRQVKRTVTDAPGSRTGNTHSTASPPAVPAGDEEMKESIPGSESRIATRVRGAEPSFLAMIS
jgi:hypothetical protein